MNKIHTIFNIETGEIIEVPFTQEEIDAYENNLVEQTWVALRKSRDSILAKSDIMVLPDRWASLTQEKKDAWTVYRQALRDLPANTIDPRDTIWPEPPEANFLQMAPIDENVERNNPT